MKNKRCKFIGKISYATVGDALMAANKYLKSNKTRLKPYVCTGCKQYHLETIKARGE